MNISRRIILLNVILTIVLLTMIIMKQWTLNTGALVLLETKPIDPRSLFRGDYVRLNYAINELSLEDLAGDSDFEKNDKVFVALEQGEPYWRPVSVHNKRPSLKSNQVAIKGTLKSVQNIHGDKNKESSGILHVHYGIENYFVPEGEGRALERPQGDKKIDMLIAVDKSGNAGIKAVLLDGEKIYTETLL